MSPQSNIVLSLPSGEIALAYTGIDYFANAYGVNIVCTVEGDTTIPEQRATKVTIPELNTVLTNCTIHVLLTDGRLYVTASEEVS